MSVGQFGHKGMITVWAGFGTWAIGNASISSFATAGRAAFLRTMFDLGSSALSVILWVGVVMAVIGIAAIVAPAFMKSKNAPTKKS